MQLLNDQHFAFLEQSPYFFDKKEGIVAKVGKEERGRDLIYTFYQQENPYQVVAKIIIPFQDYNRDIEWKYLRLEDNQKAHKPVYQKKNPSMNEIPGWFRSLVKKVNEIYYDVVNIARIFSAPNERLFSPLANISGNE